MYLQIIPDYISYVVIAHASDRLESVAIPENVGNCRAGGRPHAIEGGPMFVNGPGRSISKYTVEDKHVLYDHHYDLINKR